MPKTLADGRILLTALTTPPANIAAITGAELASGKKISCRIMKSDYTLGPTGSDTVDETEMCKLGKGQAFGQSNYSGTITVFRYLDDVGVAVVVDDFAFEMCANVNKSDIRSLEASSSASSFISGDFFPVFSPSRYCWILLFRSRSSL